MRVTDEFMRAVIDDGEWTTRAVTDGRPMETMKARDLMRGLWALPRDRRAAPWEWRRRKTLEHGFTDYGTESVAECVASLGR